MSVILSKLIFDVVEDRIYDAIVKVRNEQVAIDPSVSFNVEKEVFIPLEQNQLPFVNIVFIKEQTSQGGASKKHQSVDLHFDIEMFASVIDSSGGTADTRSAKALFYLAAQVKSALTRLAEVDLGFVPGIISKRPFPEFSRMDSIAIDGAERLAAVGKFTFIVGTSFDAKDIATINLEEITVDTGYIKSDVIIEE